MPKASDNIKIYRNPTLSSILATQMPCRSCRSGAYAARRELCGVALEIEVWGDPGSI